MFKNNPDAKCTHKVWLWQECPECNGNIKNLEKKWLLKKIKQRNGS